ncbi:UNVERIFIED_CONTAM: hypothetical protein Sradi_0675200 [Sesamum radiatum]|uniref:Retrotransposon gag domain-containing protein n=1 Tax=Sesamum radiatum TaxID=300843 RepID=A0AAW2VMR8_SESRA
MEHLSRFENAALLHRYTDGIKCRVFVTTFVGAAQQWFNQLPVGAIGSFQEFRSLFLHQFASSRKVRKTKLSLFAVRQKKDEPLKEDNNDIPRKGVIRMIAGGPSGGDSHQARKSQIREAHQISKNFVVC